MTKPINLHEEAFAVHWVRLAAEALSNGHAHFICNDLRLPRRLSLQDRIECDVYITLPDDYGQRRVFLYDP